MRIRTSGLVKQTFDIESFRFVLYDTGGQRNERRKWLGTFDGMFCFLFLISLYEFDEVCMEDGKTNRLEESLEVFDWISNSCLPDIPVILVFTHDDLFEKKFDSVNFAYYFPDFKGSSSTEARQFLKELFLKKLKNMSRAFTVHFLNATDTDQCRLFIERIFQQISNMKVEWYNLFFDKGILLQALKKYEEAVDFFGRAINLEPFHAEVFYERGRALVELGVYPEALEDFNIALQLKRDFYETYNWQAMALKALGRLQEALESAQMATFLEPNYLDAYFIQSMVFNSLGMYLESLSVCQTIFEFDPVNVKAYCCKAETLMFLNRFQEAIEMCDSAIKLDRRYGYAYYIKGAVFHHEGQFDEAMSHFKIAMELSPEIFDRRTKLWYHHQLAFKLYLCGAFQECLKLLCVNLELSSSHVLFLDLKVRCLLQLEDFDALWKCGALLKAHFNLHEEQISQMERLMIQKTIDRYLQLHRLHSWS
jgi:tetratricopeptide (TPR) repeat protein